MKKTLFIYQLLFLLFLFSCNSAIKSQDAEKLELKANDALTYCKTNGMNTTYCFLIDMSIHSGKNRFFVWNYKKKEVEFYGLVCHGSGKIVLVPIRYLAMK